MRRCLILYGLTCVIGQVLSVRELATAFHGNELVYGAVLAVWLLLFAVGSAVLGRLAGKYSLGVPAFALALAGGGALVPVTVLLARTSRYFLFESGGIAPSLGGVLLATFVALAPLCLVLGFFYALACSIVSRLEESAASAATRVYLGEAVGTFLGGILLTYVLLHGDGRVPDRARPGGGGLPGRLRRLAAQFPRRRETRMGAARAAASCSPRRRSRR